MAPLVTLTLEQAVFSFQKQSNKCLAELISRDIKVARIQAEVY